MDIYDEKIKPVESAAASKLKTTLGALQTQPGQFLREFQRYRDIIKRKTIGLELGKMN